VTALLPPPSVRPAPAAEPAPPCREPGCQRTAAPDPRGSGVRAYCPVHERRLLSQAFGQAAS
jgi:hypothetical protein